MQKLSSPEPDSVPAQPSAYYPALDGLRAIAVLAVFTCHYLADKTPLIKNWGALGVDCFFVLSGFLITGILYDSRHKTHRFRDFYMRRVLRIFPVYYGVWFLILLSWPVFHWVLSPAWLMWPFHLGNWARFAFYDPHNVYHLDLVFRRKDGHVIPALFIGHFWSLCVEEQFYLIWPMLVFFVRSRQVLIRCCLTIVIVEPLLRYAAFTFLPHYLIAAEAVWWLTPFRLDGLALGGLLALLIRGSEREWLDRYGRLLTLAAGVCFAICVVVQIHTAGTTVLQTSGRFFNAFGFATIAWLSGATILELIRPNSTAARALSWTPLRRMGQISYGFYIFHDIPHLFYNRVGQALGTNSPWVTAAIALCCTLVLSTLSFRFIETPILRLKRHFGNQAHTAPRLHAL